MDGLTRTSEMDDLGVGGATTPYAQPRIVSSTEGRQTADARLMSESMTSPGGRELLRDLWLENACRIAAFRLRQVKYLSANTNPIRE